MQEVLHVVFLKFWVGPLLVAFGGRGIKALLTCLAIHAQVVGTQ